MEHENVHLLSERLRSGLMRAAVDDLLDPDIVESMVEDALDDAGLNLACATDDGDDGDDGEPPTPEAIARKTRAVTSVAYRNATAVALDAMNTGMRGLARNMHDLASTALRIRETLDGIGDPR